MSKESFNWKSLFINEETEKRETTTQNAFPQVTNKFPETEVNSSSLNVSNNPFLNEIIEVYQKGFEGLNSEGFDFFEMYKSVNAVGVTNPQSYQMAFTMGKTINPNLSKDFLLEKAKHYLVEIEKVYEKYNITGNSKKTDLNNKITQEKKKLTTEIVNLESQISALQKELSNKKNELLSIDNNNLNEFNELQLKIEANNVAKQKIQESINLVVTGINQYL